VAALEELTLIPEPVVVELIGVVGASSGAAGVDWLLEQLEDDDFADRALQALARVAPLVPLDRAPELAARLRPQLGSESAVSRREAMRVLSGLQDEAAIPRLVELLASTETGEARAAGRALCELSGRELPADAAVWGAWLARELEWWGARGEAALEELWSEDPHTAVAAVNEVAVRGLLRDRLSCELARVLREHPEPAAREQACLGLTQLRSRAACSELVAALETGDDEVAALACRALRSITGLAHEGQARVWRDALALSR
jgi:HEAT repeat protein